MPKTTYRDYVNSLLDLIRDGLGPRLLEIYKEQFPNNFEDEISYAIGRQAAHTPRHVLRNISVLADHLDAHAVLRLATEAPVALRECFEVFFGDDFNFTTGQLYEQRNDRAHETKYRSATLWDAIYVAELSYNLLNQIGESDRAKQAEEIRAKLEDLNRQQYAPNFSSAIKRIHASIEQLTEQQKAILRELGRKPRVAISGCAGSGKTLLAIEKAIRLDRGDFRTLILCRNPRLAAYIRETVSETEVEAWDFNAWIAQIVGRQVTITSGWSQYDTPTEEELLLAWEILEGSDKRYDAILVDEAQDFSEDWWLPVEGALSEPRESAVLYLFFDDNQMLVPRKLKYPVEIAEHSLAQNIRNAGKIFDFVAQYHPQSPAPSELLRNTGYLFPFRLRGFDQQSVHDTVVRSFEHAQSYLDLHSIVFITTEVGPSIMRNLELPVRVNWDWQRVVRTYFHGIVHNPWKIKMTDEFAKLDEILCRDQVGITLGGTWLPSLSQMDFVQELAISVRERLEKLPSRQVDAFPWDIYSEKLSVHFTTHDRKYLDYFMGGTWVKDLRARYALRIGENVPLYTISEYKGLEADGVILFVNHSIATSWSAELYVGASRAKYLLCVISDASNLDQIHQQ
jgi:hypothetical protein